MRVRVLHHEKKQVNQIVDVVFRGEIEGYATPVQQLARKVERQDPAYLAIAEQHFARFLERRFRGQIRTRLRALIRAMARTPLLARLLALGRSLGWSIGFQNPSRELGANPVKTKQVVAQNVECGKRRLEGKHGVARDQASQIPRGKRTADGDHELRADELKRLPGKLALDAPLCGFGA